MPAFVLDQLFDYNAATRQRLFPSWVYILSRLLKVAAFVVDEEGTVTREKC